MTEHQTRTGWRRKFENALRGIVVGVVGQNSFYVHIPTAVCAIGIAIFLRLDAISLSVLLLCVGMVFAAELFNSALESLAKSITSQHDENIRDALDTASGAVLTLAIIAAIVGAIVFIAAFYAMT